MTRILHVVTNVSHFDDPTDPTGLWLSELTHAWDVFAEQGYEQTIVSPLGGYVPLEPRSLSFPFNDDSAQDWYTDPDRMALLGTTLSPADVDPSDFDAIYFTGGHAAMYDFPDNPGLQQLARAMWEQGGIVSSVCHGYCGLLNVQLSDGSSLIDARSLTGFSWPEEIVAGVAKKVPYNVEEAAKERGARYEKTPIPFTAHVVTDGRLVTGQNPGSAKKTAERVVEILNQSASRV